MVYLFQYKINAQFISPLYAELNKIHTSRFANGAYCINGSSLKLDALDSKEVLITIRSDSKDLSRDILLFLNKNNAKLCE